MSFCVAKGCIDVEKTDSLTRRSGSFSEYKYSSIQGKDRMVAGWNIQGPVQRQ